MNQNEVARWALQLGGALDAKPTGEEGGTQNGTQPRMEETRPRGSN